MRGATELSLFFPGDLLLKNFGVTRFGRVLFYDYDEIAPLEDCVFRELPAAGSNDEETSSEPWFYVGPRDVFPEEFPRFLFADDAHRELFLAEHAPLCTARFWREKQAQAKAGVEGEFSPYPRERKFPHAHQ